MLQPHKLNHCQQCDQQPIEVKKAGERHLCKMCAMDFLQASENTLYHPDDIRILADYSLPRDKRSLIVQVRTNAKQMLCSLPDGWGE